MKKLIPICLTMLLSAPIFAQSGSTQNPSGTDVGAGSTMSQPSQPSQPADANMAPDPQAPSSGPSSSRTPQQMEESNMNTSPGAAPTTGPGAAPATGPGAVGTEENKTAP